MAAMEALQRCERDQSIKVTRVAGTSAGAIVGALFAAGVSFGSLRQQARSADARFIDELFPERGKLKDAWRVFWGKPIWDENRVRAFLDKLFAHNTERQTPIRTLGELALVRDVPLLVVGTDLLEGRAHEFPPDSNLINAILDSCAIPFYFRSATGQGRHIVDGGICENFPALLLDSEREKFGPIVGIGFDQVPRKPPTSTKEFAESLLDAAMNSSMLRARIRVGRDFMHDIKTEIGTFEFQRAIREGFADKYQVAYDAALRFFEELPKKIGTPNGERLISNDPWVVTDRQTLVKTGSLYRAHHEQSKFHYEIAELHIQANSLCGEGHPGYGSPDTVSYHLRFRLGPDPLFCHSVAITPTEGRKGEAQAYQINDRRWSLYAADGTSVDTIDFPAIDTTNPTDRRMVLFFNPPLRSGGSLPEPFDFRFRDNTWDIVPKLKEGASDEIGITFEHALGNVAVARLVLFVPSDRTDVKLLPVQTAGVFAGRPMSPAELANYTPPFGFRTLGWHGDNIPAKQDFIATVTASPISASTRTG
jgi:predicted acylesterase/phospholipase RssA